MNIVNFDPTKVAFEQVNCTVCLDEFKTDERIKKLVCEHIFHEKCLPDSFLRCPLCKKKFREVRFDANQCRREMKKLTRTALRIFPILHKVSSPENRQEFCEEFIQKHQDYQRIQESDVDLTEMVKELNKILKEILDPQRREGAMQRLQLYARTYLQGRFENTPYDLLEDQFLLGNAFPAEIVLMGKLAVFSTNQEFRQFAKDFIQRFNSDPEIFAILQRRKAELVRQTIPYLVNASTFQQIQYLRRVNVELLPVLSGIPKTALAHNALRAGRAAATVLDFSAYNFDYTVSALWYGCLKSVKNITSENVEQEQKYLLLALIAVALFYTNYKVNQNIGLGNSRILLMIRLYCLYSFTGYLGNRV